MEEIKVKLAVFEGPLDLLLHLIQQLEIDIYDIPIAEVTNQYLSYLHTMQSLQLEVAGEYLVMAATLMALKSQMLLPKQEIEFAEFTDYEEDPRDDLVNQLLEYRKFKYAAGVLAEKEAERSQLFTKEATNLTDYLEEPVLLPDKFNKIDLFLAIHELLEKKRQQQPLTTTVESDEITIEESLVYLRGRLARLSNGEELLFESLFVQNTRQGVVTTFLALLELIKKGEATIRQADNFQAIQIFRTEGS
jgi:segregation and condensation protein A